jgi:hypothetical protein
MTRSKNFTSAAGAILGAAITSWPVSAIHLSGPFSEFPGHSAYELASALTFFTWAILFFFGCRLLIAIPRRWAGLLQAASWLAVSGVLSTVACLLLFWPTLLARVICDVSPLCTMSDIPAAIYHAQSNIAHTLPIPEAWIGTGLIVAVAMVFRRRDNAKSANGLEAV